MTPCPRCARENPPTAGFCAGCGTPLAFDDGPAPGRLDVELDLDRRRRAQESTEPELVQPPSPSEDPTGPAFEPDRSDWRIGLPEEAPEELTEPGSASDEPKPAPPARRLAAWAIDGALIAGAAIGVPAAVIGFGGLPPPAGATPCAFGSGLGMVLLLSEAFVAVVAFVYATAAHALAGATLGKRIAHLRVIDEDGRVPGPATSAARSAWAVLSLALAGAGFVPALVTPSRRALHDLLAGTRVVESP